MLCHDISIKTPVAVLLEVRSTNAAHRPGYVSYYVAFIVDTDNKAQRELVYKLRALYQERSDIQSISERFFVLVLMPEAAQGGMVA